MRLTHPFEPVYDENALVLILGSYPSVGSVEGGGYYGARFKNGKPRNDFWQLIGEVFLRDRYALVSESVEVTEHGAVKATGPTWTWDTRYAVLRDHHVALWDVVASCERDGPSSDGDLREVRANDIRWLAAKLPGLELVAFTGQRAASLFRHYVIPAAERRVDDSLWDIDGGAYQGGTGRTFNLLALPSPSRANATPYARKLEAYRAAILPYLGAMS